MFSGINNSGRSRDNRNKFSKGGKFRGNHQSRCSKGMKFSKGSINRFSKDPIFSVHSPSNRKSDISRNKDNTSINRRCRDRSGNNNLKRMIRTDDLFRRIETTKRGIQ
jgi:hypothetical protein